MLSEKIFVKVFRVCREALFVIVAIAMPAVTQALKPGDTIAMACSMCKNISIYHVDETDAHLKLMTIGGEHTCPVCGGTVAVVGTGKGTGENEKVKHVCSKCGDDAMFVAASRNDGHAHLHKGSSRKKGHHGK